MNAITDVYRALLASFQPRKKVVSFGFVYVDTFKVLETTGAKDAVLYGQGSTTELGELEDRLKDGEEILALFCEFPDQYDFAVVGDDTIGTFVNCDLLPYADIVVTSLVTTSYESRVGT